MKYQIMLMEAPIGGWSKQKLHSSTNLPDRPDKTDFVELLKAVGIFRPGVKESEISISNDKGRFFIIDKKTKEIVVAF